MLYTDLKVKEVKCFDALVYRNNVSIPAKYMIE